MYGRRRGPHPDDQVDVVRLDRQFHDVPGVLLALRLDRRPSVGGEVAQVHGLAPLRAPDQMAHDEVDPVFVPLKLHVNVIDGIGTRINGLIRNAESVCFPSAATEVAWPPKGRISVCIERGEASKLPQQ
jgi:hypothetical protein